MSFGFSLQALEMSKSFLAPLLFGLHDLHDSRVWKKQKPARRNIGNKRKGLFLTFLAYLKAVKQTNITGVQANKTACFWISIKCNVVQKILPKFKKTSHQRPKVHIFVFFLSSICTYCCLQRKGLTFILIKNTHVSVQIGTLHACRPTRRLHQL